MRKFSYEGTPLIFALVLGPMFENVFQQSLLLSNGSFLIFLTRPISAGFMAIAIILLVTTAITKSSPGKRLGTEKE